MQPLSAYSAISVDQADEHPRDVVQVFPQMKNLPTLTACHLYSDDACMLEVALCRITCMYRTPEVVADCP